MSTNTLGRSSRRGAVSVMVALTTLVILGFVGLAIDSAYVMSTKQQLQAAADAGALAATRVVQSDPLANDPSTPYGTTRDEAVQCALQNTAAKAAVVVDHNYPNAVTGDVVVGVWDGTNNSFTPDTSAPNAVQVTCRRSTVGGGGPLGMIFGRLFNKQTIDISRTAIATTGQGDDPWILILDPTGEKAFQLRGTPFLTAPGGTIHINSSAADALYLNGAPNDPRVQAGTIRVYGDAQYPTGAVTPIPQTNTWIEPDYLMYLPDHPDPDGGPCPTTARSPARGPTTRGATRAGSTSPTAWPGSTRGSTSSEDPASSSRPTPSCAGSA